MSNKPSFNKSSKSLKRDRQPLGGADPVHIPPLNADPLDGGGTMNEQASALQDPTNPMSPSYSPELSDMGAKKAFASLPPDAQNDPRFVSGMGSMIAGNQPQLSGDSKSRGERSGTAPDGQYKPGMSDETMASMKALEEFQLRAQQHQNTPVKKGESERVVEDIKETTSAMDELRDMLQDDSEWDRLNNPERRKRIEDRLTPMDITDIFVHGEVRQDIQVTKSVVLTFRSVSGSEDLAVKRLMFGDSGSDRYMVDKYTIMQLTLALVSINGQDLPDHLTPLKKFDEDLFNAKFDRVVQFPIEFLADYGLQYYWFHERIRALLSDETEQLKNG